VIRGKQYFELFCGRIRPAAARRRRRSRERRGGPGPRSARGWEKVAIAPDAIARAIAFAIAEPPDVDINEIVVRPTAQG
jgi:NADP-dependent 3-hydroxy acid dehydrogenase YdfG